MNKYFFRICQPQLSPAKHIATAKLLAGLPEVGIGAPGPNSATKPQMPTRSNNSGQSSLNRMNKMHRLKICLSTLGALFVLGVVAASVLGSIAFDWFKEALGAFLTDSRHDVTG